VHSELQNESRRHPLARVESHAITRRGPGTREASAAASRIRTLCGECSLTRCHKATGITLQLGELETTTILDAIPEALEHASARGVVMYQHACRAVLPQMRQLLLHGGGGNRVATKSANISNKAAM